MSLVGKVAAGTGGRFYESTPGDGSAGLGKHKGKRSRDRKHEVYRLLRERVLFDDDGRIRPCAARCGGRAESVHHLLGGPRRAMVLENLVPLCGDGTRGCHGVYTTHHRLGTGRDWRDVATSIRETLDEHYPDRVAYVVAEVNEAGLDRLYPKGASMARIVVRAEIDVELEQEDEPLTSAEIEDLVSSGPSSWADWTTVRVGAARNV